jgi:hypothetical protein
MQAILKFIGIENIHELTMDNTLGPDRNDTIRRRDALIEQARQMAKDF